MMFIKVGVDKTHIDNFSLLSQFKRPLISFSKNLPSVVELSVYPQDNRFS